MTQAQLVHAVAVATGESPRTVARLGFSVAPDGPTDFGPLYLAVDCPHCRKPARFPGQLADGSCPLAECPGCDALFAFDLDDVRVTAARPA
jgi:hypothetical protein